MEANSFSSPVRLRAAANGVVYGVRSDGVVARFSRRGIRALTTSLRAAGDFDETDVEATYLPTPPPSFPVTDFAVSDTGRSVLIKGPGHASLGVARLDAKRVGDLGTPSEVPFQCPVEVEDVEVLSARWFPGQTETLCVLRGDATLSLYDALTPLYPERVYRLQRQAVEPLGISQTHRALPVDFAFLPSLPWGPFTVLVLYEDGSIYSLCPVFPVGQLQETILKAAAKSPISRDLLKRLLTECLSQGSEFLVQYVPSMQGPINEGLLSQWQADFEDKKCDSAACLSCASYDKGYSTVTVGTSYGVLYSHALIDDIKPDIIPPLEAIVTPVGLRVCLPKVTEAKLHLVEIVELQKKPMKKKSLSLWQDPRHPELMHCTCGEEVLRLSFGWVTNALFGESGETELESSKVWRFNRDAQFLGSFHDLDASIAVFGRGFLTSASIVHSKSIGESHIEVLPSPDPSTREASTSEEEEDVEALGCELAEVEDPSFGPLKEAYQKYEYSTLDDTGFGDYLTELDTEADRRKEWIADLEDAFYRLDGQTDTSMQALVECVSDPWPHDTIHDTLVSTKARLDEVSID